MTKKRIFFVALSVFGTIIIGVAAYLNSLLPIITGYAAKNLCSGVFVSGREAEDIEAIDLNFSFIKLTNNEVDYSDKSVTSKFLWGKSKAIFREGFGATLVRDIPEAELRDLEYPVNLNPGYSQDTIKWPLGNMVPDSVTGIDINALRSITDHLINDSGSYNGNAFAFLVLHKGIPVAEGYKPQFNMNTRFISWSMAKSFTNALVGILVKQGILDINSASNIEEWNDDNRKTITLNNLMQMQSGLKWNEDYGNRSDVTVMLHCERDMSQYAIKNQLEYEPGTFWYYSSGTSNIISEIIRRKLNNDSLYYSFTRRQLFEKTGMPDAIIEVDPSGTMIGSSYIYATARDYARFGLLYLNDGVFNNDRILPEGWVKYTTSAASASNGQYGSLFWLNRGKKLPSAPEDMYLCVGHDGQRIFILPTEELVVVVLGYSPSSNGGMNFDSLIKDVISAL